MKYFIVKISTDPALAVLRGTVLYTFGRTLEDAEATMQMLVDDDGFNPDKLVVASPERGLPGVMTSTDGKPVLIGNMGWTDEAFAKFVIRAWSN